MVLSVQSTSRPPRAGGFAAAELAVVVGTFGVLITLVLLPAIVVSRSQSRGAVCQSNLHQIGVGMLSFAAENDDALYTVPSPFGGYVPNSGHWTETPRSPDMLQADHPLAYWGVAYFDHVGRSREVFRCPSARRVDEWRDAGLNYPSEFWLNSSYGLSEYAAISRKEVPRVPRKMSGFANPSTTILAQDAFEQRMEGEGDSLGLFPGYSEILTSWRNDLASYYGGYPFQSEWYRHEQRCQTLWVSGHVSRIRFTGLNVGIDYRYYTGETPRTPLPED